MTYKLILGIPKFIEKVLHDLCDSSSIGTPNALNTLHLGRRGKLFVSAILGIITYL